MNRPHVWSQSLRAVIVMLLAGCGKEATGPSKVASVTVSPATITVLVGDTARLRATVKDAAGAVLTDRAVTWTSGNPSVATVSADGLVTGVQAAAQQATITATSEGVHGSAAITVMPVVNGEGQIAFVSFRDSTLYAIYVMNADGSGVTQLTKQARSPVWSPDGTKIAFTSWRHAGAYAYSLTDVYVMNADGSGVTNLTNNPAPDNVGPWSPDGTKILFVRYIAGGTFEIHVMNADGTGDTQLTNGQESNDCCGLWSPDGRKILFARYREGGSEIYVMNADGSGVTNLTNNPAIDVGGSWSPDGTKILFQSNRDGTSENIFNDTTYYYEIYVMNADGSGVTRLTDNPARDANSNWSPDGTKILFSSNRDGNEEIYVMNADGSGVTRLTDHPTPHKRAQWAPDGTKILFVSFGDGNEEIYVMNADGSGVTNLTNNPAHDFDPAWRPRAP